MIEIQLTQGQVAIIDDEDSWVLDLGNWQAYTHWHIGDIFIPIDDKEMENEQGHHGQSHQQSR